MQDDAPIQTPYVDNAPAVTGGFGAIEFAENPEPRVACLLLLDTSGSMAGTPIAALNSGIQQFKEELMTDSLAAKRVEVAIVTFGSTPYLAMDFVSASSFQPPRLEAEGGTAMGAAIEEGLRRLDARKQMYKENGIAYFRPWVFLITDGSPTDSVTQAAVKVRNGEANHAFLFYGVGAGPHVDFNRLNEICPPGRPAAKLEGMRFRELFSWLSKSMGTVSRSTPGTAVSLPAPTGWISAPT
ncbi:MAG TPA: VWA domain-containing protein [Candidatus Baltobacteraceae bacterium]|nr:VWA domain-containing protein [Candidatus Baltobacteraceae bacterium]